MISFYAYIRISEVPPQSVHVVGMVSLKMFVVLQNF